ncbi:MAG: class I SAM-dependent methyltransferase [Pseudomonadota bacterium]
MAKKDRKKLKGKNKKKVTLTAESADRHVLYEKSVQSVEPEIDFVDEFFSRTRGRVARYLREDFCGTGNTSCEWVRRRPSNYALGVDLDTDVTAWGEKHHIAALNTDQQERIGLINENVLEVKTQPQDAILAMNFSYMIFKTRDTMRDYFRNVHAGLIDDGIFYLDCFGGYDAFREMKEKTAYDDFSYIWEQAAFNPITNDMLCHIHFKFKDGSWLKRAFTYEWRLWSLPEIRELLGEAGFKNVTVHWQGWDEDQEEGNGEFTPVTNADADAGWIAYITGEK